jgi:hypothetical protein
VKQFELSIDREIKYMIKYQLTADELFVLRLIFYAQEGHGEYISTFFSECQLGSSLRSILSSLQTKGIINKSYSIPEEGTVFKADDVDLNKHAVNQFLQHSTDMGMELFEAYPAYTTINGRTFSLRNITKNFKDLDDMCWQYGRMIKFDQRKHEEILELLEYAKENDLIHSGICDFILSQGWLALELYRDEGMGYFDNTTLIN